MATLPTINLGGSNLPPEILAQQQQLNRQQQMAQLLMQQGMNQPSGQMVSGRYVAPSFFQYAAPLVQMYAGSKLAEKGDKAAVELAQQLRNQQQKMGEQYFEALQGKPATYGADIPTETYETVKGSMISPATGPDYRKALSIATDPDAPTWMKNQATEMLKAQKLGPEETLMQRDLSTGELRPVGIGAPKIRNPLQVNVGNAIEFRDPTDPSKLLYKVPIAKEPSTAKDFSNALALRKEFNSEGIYKGYQEVKNAWSQINTGLNAKSPAGDLAAATKFMKLLDPTSVVRESELVMAMQASGALDRLYNYARMRVNGEKLTPNQREDFRTLADQFYQTSLNQYNEKFNEYKDIALRNNLNPMDIGKPEEFKKQTPATTEKPPKPNVSQQLNVPAVKAPKFLGFE